MKLWVLVPSWIFESENVTDLVLSETRWRMMDGASIPGGDGGPVFQSGGFILLHPVWEEGDAKLYAKQWDPMRLEQVEVSDVFVAQLGIR